MEEKRIPLCSLTEGEVGRVCSITATEGLRRRLSDLGLVRGTMVENLCSGPFGGIAAYCVKGTVVALRRTDAGKVEVCVWD